MPHATKTKQHAGQVATRPPVVVVMGHIDHGKTTLLDHIRNTKVAEREAGGITQAIGAYQTAQNGKRITFIDTPGHEAFSAMRTRGAHVADVAVLVVAADEGVKPQTEEAIRLMQSADLPFVVAINKSDAPNADPARVRAELAEKGVLVEGFGGTVPSVELSAKTGAGVDTLLETILLLAELEELTADAGKPGEGVVIESHRDPKRGATATLLVEDGTVSRGDYIAVGKEVAPVRILENFLGAPVAAAGPAEPIRITGFGEAPALGERFRVFKTRAEAEGALSQLSGSVPSTAKEIALAAPDHTTVNIVLKADVLGSQEAVEEILGRLTSPELGSRILKSGVGDVMESDVKLASASAPAIVVGFKVKVPPQIREFALREGVAIILGDVIYDLSDAVKNAMLVVMPARVRRVLVGKARILALFRDAGSGKQIVGGKVEAGKIARGATFDVIRNSMKIGAGRVAELQSQHRAAEEVSQGEEFGLLAHSDVSLAGGDTLELFAEENVIPQL